MRHPSAGGAGGGARCYKYAVHGALFSTCYESGQKLRSQKTTRTRHATVPMVEGDAEGGGGGDLANGPLDGRRNRGSNPRRRRLPIHGAYY